MSKPSNTASSPEAPVTESKAEAAGLTQHDLEQARVGLSKLPIMGPALWLYGRDPVRKFSFIADMDWLLLPPVILDQCRLFTKNGIPTGFFTWAFVSDVIDARLRSGVARLAPHEWKSGSHLWLIDMVSPFGTADEMVSELLQGVLAGHRAHALLPNPVQGGGLTIHAWPA
ncbi:toxin-activating lysine-acyltransferase [Collimonas pratensis]|nr:toxin-activating lysine-acyltransferase [Collimonas pratensis]